MKSGFRGAWMVMLVLVWWLPAPASAADTLAVIDLTAKGGIDRSLAIELSEAVRQEFAKSGMFAVLDRDNMPPIKAGTEGEMQPGCDHTECLVDIGRAAGARYVAGGSLTGEKDSCYVHLRLIDVSQEGLGVKRSVSKRCRNRKDDLIVTARMITAMFTGRNWEEVVREFAKERPLPLEPPHDQPWREPVTGMEFAWVKGGCFLMGCGPWSGKCEADEKPAHEVCVDAFWMGKFEVTQAQWQKVMGENPARYNKGGDYPVEQVAADDVAAFIRKLNAENRSLNIFRLPTEAEWEYAARSGGKEELHAGGASLDTLAWHRANAGEEPRLVGAREPNGLGLYDMSGNVYEWCGDWYGENYYGISPKNNPTGPTTGEKRVIRGGAASSKAGSLRTTNRGSNAVSCPNYMVGVRLVWAPAKDREGAPAR